MRATLLGSTGLRVSELCLGTATFGNDEWGADREDSRAIFEAYYEAGGRFYDCANTYADGRSEELLGSFAKGRREELVIATKFTAATRKGDANAWGSHRKSLRDALEASLRRLDTDYVDVLWVHAWDELTPFEEIVRALDDAIAAGKVLYVGASNTPAWGVAHANGIARANHWTPFCAIQNQYNVAERTIENDLLPMARHLGLAVLGFAPLAFGALAGGYRAGSAPSGVRLANGSAPAAHLSAGERLAQIADELATQPATLALAWLRHRDVPVIPVVGIRRRGQLAAALNALELRLEPDVVSALDAIAPPPPVLPQAFLRGDDGIAFFDQGLRETVVTRR
jgi:aryl-alcohol dehydrogenase-like predicted oxidoreductase